VIFSERRGQSQKPEELYEMIEELVPNGNVYYPLETSFSSLFIQYAFFRKLFGDIWT
jgi:hypothetical protein